MFIQPKTFGPAVPVLLSSGHHSHFTPRPRLRAAAAAAAEMRDARARPRPRPPPPAIPSGPRVARRSPRLARPPLPASPSGPRGVRRSPRLAPPPSPAPGSGGGGGGGEDDHPGALLHLRQGDWEQADHGVEVPNMASRARLSLLEPDATHPERPPPALTSDLHEEIFLRVASPADLARASCACTSFRSLIADHAFLRRYRSIHPPLLLGFVSPYKFHPAEAPHPSAAVARSVTFSFYHRPRSTTVHFWDPADVCDGRVLLKRRPGVYLDDWELLVWDPLSLRRVLLPPIPGDVHASIGITSKYNLNAGASFIRSGSIEEDTSFRVIYWIIYWTSSSSRLGAFIFSSDSGCWSAGASVSCDDLGLDEAYQFISKQCMNGCFYWKSEGINTLVKLDMNCMQFCTIGLPPCHEEREIVIVDSGESGLALFSKIYEGTSVDYYTVSQNGGEKSHEWHLKSTIPLPGHDARLVGGPAEGYIFLECTPDEEDAPFSEFLSLDIKSFNIERVSRTGFPGSLAYPYFGFPPSMSPRRIQDYGEGSSHMFWPACDGCDL